MPDSLLAGNDYMELANMHVKHVNERDSIIADLKSKLINADSEIARLEQLLDNKERECDSLLAELDSFRYNQRYYNE